MRDRSLLTTGVAGAMAAASVAPRRCWQSSVRFGHPPFPTANDLKSTVFGYATRTSDIGYML